WEAPLPRAVPGYEPPRESRQVGRSGTSRRLPLKLWRLVLALLVANAMLAGVLYFQRGTIPGIYEGSREFRDGGTATVLSETLNVRSAAGLTAAPLYSVAFGTTVEIEGDAEAADGELWWPVTVPGRPDLEAGYIWQGGIEPDIITGRERLENVLGSQTDRLRDEIRDRL